MMSQAHCIQKAETCERRAAMSVDAALQIHWSAMAVEWRALSGDKTDGATLARLMSSSTAG